MGIFDWIKKKEETFEDFPTNGGLMISKMVIEEGDKARNDNNLRKIG